MGGEMFQVYQTGLILVGLPKAARSEIGNNYITSMEMLKSKIQQKVRLKYFSFVMKC